MEASMNATESNPHEEQPAKNEQQVPPTIECTHAAIDDAKMRKVLRQERDPLARKIQSSPLPIFCTDLVVLYGLRTKWYKLSASSEENMEETWTQRANNVLALMEKVPSGAEGSPEKNFQRAVWSLCQQLKDSETGGSQLIAPSIMSD
jgi:hypothetical protein